MSSIVTALTGGGNSGMGYTPSSANIQNPATTDQANTAYTNAQAGLNNQAGFLNAVQAQNGLGNQTQVYNQLQGVANGTGANPAQAQLAQATGTNVANQNALMAGQRGSSANVGMMARQAAQVGAGTQQAAAGQAATLQANQSLNALSAMGTMANTQAQQQANATNAYSTAAQGEQSNILGAIGAQNNANVGMQSNMNSVSGQLANNVASQQGGVLGSVVGAGGSALQGVGSLFGGASGAASATGASSTLGAATDTGGMAASAGGLGSSAINFLADGGDVQGISALDPNQQPSAQTPANGEQVLNPTDSMQQAPTASNAANKTTGAGIGAGLGSMLPSAAQTASLANNVWNGIQWVGGALGNAGSWAGTQLGGAIAGGGDAIGAGAGELGAGSEAIAGAAAPVAADAAVAAANGGIIPASFAGKHFKGMVTHTMPANTAMMAQGGKVPVMLSPGEKRLTPEQASQVAKGGAKAMATGQTVPGKPVVGGAKNSYANDVVATSAEPGTIIIPRSITQSKDAEKKAAAFVKAHFKAQSLKKGT